jgi:putative holliday junction resolvase
MPPSRLLAIDYGLKRIGLALTDPLRILARPYLTIANEGFAQVAEQLRVVVERECVERLVIGLPLNHEGEDTRQTALVRRFAEKIGERLAIPVVFHDERFSTEEANREIKRMGINPIEGRKIIDQIAATLILREYLETETT